MDYALVLVIFALCYVKDTCERSGKSKINL
jgi:hypothetical protein